MRGGGREPARLPRGRAEARLRRFATVTTINDDLARERAKQIFRFLKALAERNSPSARFTSDHQWVLRLADLPEHLSIIVGQVQLNGNGEQNPEELEPLMRVKRPILRAAPPPPDSLTDWLRPGWDKPDADIAVLAVRQVEKAGERAEERFDANSERVRVFDEWKGSWLRWSEAEIPARAAMKIFDRFYDLYGRIERESESVEVILGDGRLRWWGPDGHVDHPVLLQRVELQFDTDVPEFEVVDTDR